MHFRAGPFSPVQEPEGEGGVRQDLLRAAALLVLIPVEEEADARPAPGGFLKCSRQIRVVEAVERSVHGGRDSFEQALDDARDRPLACRVHFVWHQKLRRASAIERRRSSSVFDGISTRRRGSWTPQDIFRFTSSPCAFNRVSLTRGSRSEPWAGGAFFSRRATTGKAMRQFTTNLSLARPFSMRLGKWP